MSNYQGPSYWDMYADQWRRLGNIPHYVGMMDNEAFPLHYRNDPYLDAGAIATGGGLAALGAAGAVAAAPVVAAAGTAGTGVTATGAATTAAPVVAAAGTAAASPAGQNLINRAATLGPTAYNWISNVGMRAAPAVQQALNSPLTRNRIDPLTLNTMARSGMHNVGTIARDFSVPGASFWGSGQTFANAANALRTGQLTQIPVTDLAMRGFASYMAYKNMENAYNSGVAQSNNTGSPAQGVSAAVQSWADGIPISPVPPWLFMGGMAADLGNDVLSPSVLQRTTAGMMIPAPADGSMDYQASYINSLLQSMNPADRARGNQLVANREAATRPIGSRVDSATDALMFDFKRPVFDFFGIGEHPDVQLGNNIQSNLDSYMAAYNSPQPNGMVSTLTPTSHMANSLMAQGFTSDQASRMAPAYIVEGLMSEANTAMQSSVFGPGRNTPEGRAIGQNAADYQKAMQAFAQVAAGRLPQEIFDQAMHQFMEYRQSGFKDAVPPTLRFDKMLEEVNAQANQGQSSEPKPAGAL